jgi:RimJ/RimL family protein N-acetyltransferase
MDARLETAWPLFDLRLRTERLVLRLPTDVDLVSLMALARAGIHPPGEMPFGVAWSTVPSPAFERDFLQHHWSRRGTWTADDWWLNLLVEREGDPIGSQTVHAVRFSETRTVHTGSWLGRAFQGRGFGKEMRGAVLGFAFDGLGARLAATEAFLDNVASNGVSRSLGYRDDGFGSLAPEGIERTTQRFTMTADDWHSRSKPLLEIDGLEACLVMFGVGRDSTT